MGGAAIVLGAGGQVTDLDGGAFDGETGRVLASNGRIHDQMHARSCRTSRAARTRPGRERDAVTP